jgi:hypothetical protein
MHRPNVVGALDRDVTAEHKNPREPASSMP